MGTTFAPCTLVSEAVVTVIEFPDCGVMMIAFYRASPGIVAFFNAQCSFGT